MLPTVTDNGSGVAAIIPAALASIALYLRGREEATGLLTSMLPMHGTSNEQGEPLPGMLPGSRSIVVVLVDGLGHANLKAAAGHARALTALPKRRLETVIPTTTGAALTSLTTGRLPGTHGLIGYKIRHPQLGLISTLKDWHEISDPRVWQRAQPLFRYASAVGARSVAIGRPAHASGGLTRAILDGAEYHSGQTIAERFAIASRLLRERSPLLVYLYVDELDKVAHREGWQSAQWVNRLEQFDAALDKLLRTLPGEVGVIVTADHGVLDVPQEHRLLLDDLLAPSLGGVPGEVIAAIGGEPRLRSLYLNPRSEAHDVADAVQRVLRGSAWVGTRDEAIAADWFGPVAAEVKPRLGEVLVAARGQRAFMLRSEAAATLEMVGQHGGLSDVERGVPLAVGGTFAHTPFSAALAQVSSRVRYTAVSENRTDA